MTPNAASAAQLRQIIDIAPDENPKPLCDDDQIKQLSKLSPLDYARMRKPVAKILGIGVGALDAAVKSEHAQDAPTGQGRPVEFDLVDPWPQRVEGAPLLTELSNTLREYVVLSDVQADAVALWCIFTHTHDAFDIAPKLVLRSAQKRCGKTRLATAVERLVRRPLYVSGIKPAALLRMIEGYCPTLLLDELDAAMKGNREMAEALRGLINSGFDRAGARYIMNVPLPGGAYEPRQFSTWAPQLLSGIGHLPDTVRDRSIELEMTRKRQDEKVKRLRRKDGVDLNELAQKSARWAQDNLDALRKANPKIPDGLNDRAADAWEPLFAIAEIATGEWLERARKAALALSGEHMKEDDEKGTLLLGDIRDMFGTDEQLTSEKLVTGLIAREDRPWAEFGRARKPITAIRLASLLRPYKIKPGTIRIGPGDRDTAKGYKRAQFIDAFERYLPPPAKAAVTPSQPNELNNFDANKAVTSSAPVTDENAENASAIKACDGVTALMSGHWETEI
jgi:putative DNA primase/helicase